MEFLSNLLEMTAFAELIAEPAKILMLSLAILLLYLGIFKGYEPLLLIPIGFGVLLANIPGGSMAVMTIAEDEEIKKLSLLQLTEKHGIMNLLYYTLIKSGLLPPLIFMGVGAMTDFGPMLRNLKLAFFCCCAIGNFHCAHWCRLDWL